MKFMRGCLGAALIAGCLPMAVDAQHIHDTPPAQHVRPHTMMMKELGAGWMAIGMAQAFPIATMAVPSTTQGSLSRGLYLTQPAVMVNLESPGSRIAFKATLNFEGLTQPAGELTLGGWGEGFLDKRHPHTLVHEALLSVNLFRQDAEVSISAGKGFAPYGTDDPMSRPGVKYPTNHHLSQILERFTVNTAWRNRNWSVEAGVFGGSEPTGPYDLSNIESFPDSWSARVTRRFGAALHGTAAWELSGSFGHITESHGGHSQATRLVNAALRHEQDYGFGRMYALAEASRSVPEQDAGYYSVLAETRLEFGRKQPYLRVELATRPEFARVGERTQQGFFRYDYDANPIGATRWLIATAGFGLERTGLPFSLRPFAEAQYQSVTTTRGDIDPRVLYGRSRFFTFSAGFRIFLGGEPMRMGAYGVLDPMTLMHREMMTSTAQSEHQH